MKKIVYSMLLLALFSCSTVKENIDTTKRQEIIRVFENSKKEFLSYVNNNEQTKMKKFFLNTWRNSYVLNYLNQLDLSKILIFIPDNSIDVYSNTRLNTIMVATISNSTMYFKLEWILENNIWKISKFEEIN